MNTEPNNIINHSTGTVIINGGNPLPGSDCPTEWKQAELIEAEFNEGKGDDFEEPRWKFDCGFKLDFDGALLRISSRFYPPKKHYGEGWDGHVRLLVGSYELDDSQTLVSKEFKCATLEQLHKEVEDYTAGLRKKIIQLLRSELKGL